MKELINRQDTVTRIFKALVRESLGEFIYVTIKPSGKDYLEILMEFSLIHYEVYYPNIQIESVTH